MTLYTIYDHPRDFPKNFVVREWVVGRDNKTYPEYSLNRWLYDSLEEARKPLKERGLVCVQRDENDDPVIVETWM